MMSNSVGTCPVLRYETRRTKTTSIKTTKRGMITQKVKLGLKRYFLGNHFEGLALGGIIGKEKLGGLEGWKAGN
jgi:hypothetical protein